MAENYGGENQAKRTVSRRDFLKKTVITGAGVGIAVVGLDTTEKNAREKGITTSVGTFFPLYETHYKGPDVEKIPNDLDVFFREGAGKNLFNSDVPAKAIFGTPIATYYNIDPVNDIKKKFISDPVLEKIVINKMEIMLGDVVFPSSPIATSIKGLAEFSVGTALSLKAVKEARKPGVSRRSFMKILGFGSAAAWLTVPSAYFLSRGGPMIDKFNVERDDALDRVVDRLYGLTSTLHPEEVVFGVFFRNLIMTNNMLTVAENIKEKIGRNPKIGFNVEYGHNGIEDFLRAGPDVCRWIISRFPEVVLKNVAELNDGPKNLWTSRLFKFPQDFFQQDPEKRWENVTSRMVEDKELKKTLEPVLS